MGSNRTLLFFILGISLLPKIYSDIHPSLIVKKLNINYVVADEIQYVGNRNDVLKFSTSPEYQLFNACPKENSPHFQQYALTVQQSVIDFEIRPLRAFFSGYYAQLNCRNPIKPIVLKSIERPENKVAPVYDIGFLFYEWNTDFGDVWKKYPSLHHVPYPQNYDFIPFLTVTMDRSLGTIKSVCHRIISRGLLEPVSALNRFQPNEKNVNFYGFDVNSLYTEENQEIIFYSTFGKQSSLYYDHKEDRCFIKVQLAPPEDFLFNTWKLPSLMDLNTAAMWKKLYRRWRITEEFVRKVARDLEPLIVETGTAEILTLTKGNNQPQSVYLRQKQKSPVSKYIWKQITFKESDDDENIQAIFIVMHNDPYTENQTPICEDVGDNLGWTVSNNDYKTGLTYVCPVNENVTSKLHVEYKGNYAPLNLNIMRKLESDENDIHPSLFIIKKPNGYYTVAEKFQYVEGENNMLNFLISRKFPLYNACPEKNALFYRKFTLKVQESVTDFKATPLEQFVKGDFINYNCSSPIKPVALKIKQKKHKKELFFKYHIGFVIRDENADFEKISKKFENFIESREYNFLHFLTIWRDKQSGTTVSVLHQIISRGLLQPDPPYSGPFQPNEKNVNFYGFDVNSLYTKENQHKMFSSIFGKQYSRYYDHKKDRYLIKVQLAPPEDFLLHVWKLPSFMDLNTTAMWKHCHPQWRIIETFVRKVARGMDKLIVETGTAEILTLAEGNNHSQSVYLREWQKFPVFKYIWKQITFKQSDDEGNIQAILIVMHNDPYTPDQETICEDVGENLGWIVSNNDYKTGLTYVCPVEENIMKRLQLHNENIMNYPTFNLKNMPMTKYDKKDTFPSLFIMKNPDTFYTVADEFEYIKGQEIALKFSTSPEHQLYNACPEENAPFYPKYTLKVQELVTDFEASPLQQFVKGDFIKYNCRYPIKPIVLKTTQIFEDTFLFEYDIGFLIREENGNFDKLSEYYESFPEIQEYNFLYFLTITMDEKSGTILSVVHQILSGGLLEPEPANSSPLQSNEKNTDVYGFDVNSLYTEGNQRKMFSSIFGQLYTDYYNPPYRSLRKVQLAPYDDFLLDTWKLTSFMDLNTTAMWEQLYGQWRRIEIFVRSVARKLKKLTIETGTARILSLTDANNLQQSVYLREEQKSYVPQYIWKMVKFEQLSDDYYTRAILIVMHNDPYTPDQEPICEDVSENWGWMVSNKDYKTGLTYGCSVNESITTQLHEKFIVNYASLNLNDVRMFNHDENDTFPSLFITKKPDMFYTVADEFEYIKGRENALKFSTSIGHQLYNACPEDNAPFYPTYTLKVQELVTDFEASPLQQFVKGDFIKYNCRYPIKPIVLKTKTIFEDTFVFEYDIGFLIHEKNGNLDKLSELYENFPEIQEYNFLYFLTITMDEKSGTILSVVHRIISGGLLEPEPANSSSLQSNEKNIDFYGFDVNFLYTEENQRKMFSSIFGQLYTDYYNPPHRSLRKVQLAPHDDFLLDTWKLSSFMDLNTTAMWEQLYSQWKRIEVFVRGVARELKKLTIETGTGGILSLTDANDLQQSVYLREEQKSNVPLYMWKMIKFVQLSDDYYTQAILIVMHNDPYTPDQKPICEDVSENWGWMVSNKDYETGLTYGCPVNESITTQLHEKFNVNYASLNLNDVRMLNHDENDTFPSLFIMKNPDMFYTAADEFEYTEGQDNVLKFSTSPGNELYNACPEENAPFYPTYALKVQELVTDFEASPFQQFVKGDFVEYNCQYPIKPIVLKTKTIFEDTFLFEYDIGFLIRKENGNFEKLSELYENFPEIQEYNFLYFLTITIDEKSGTILSVVHQILSGGLLEPEPANSSSLQSNEKNIDVYGFDVNSLYAEENQRKMFSSIFGQLYIDYYNPPYRSLRKVQLAPYGDFLLDTWKLTSFMDLNTTAMWEQLYSQWKRIEVFVRGVARKLKKLTIETGTGRILSLTDANDLQQSVYLREDQKSPVLEYIWKMIKFKQLDDDYYTQAILIVMHNDPYTPDQKPICEDVSENWGWMVSNKDYKTGLTYGCPVNESITAQLHDKFNENYANLNLNDVRMFNHDENDTFPSLFIMKKPNTFYAVADKLQRVDGQDNLVKFSTSPGYQLYNACPYENAPFHRTYTLKVQELVTDFEASPLQHFVKGDFVKYNCRYPIKPIVLKSKITFHDPYTVQYDIGFLIHKENGYFEELSEFYENFTEIQEYDFLRFLMITMNVQLGTILSVVHRIITRKLLKAEAVYSSPFPPNEKNFDIYRFDVDFLYTEENQQKMLSSIFGQSYTRYYSHPNKCLRKTQLAPHEDYLLNTWKLSSFTDLNTTAMWGQLQDQWRRIEIFVRRVAQEVEPLTIETGAAGILSLADFRNQQQPVYLREEQKSAVSKYIWKLVQFRQLYNNIRYTQAILIVMHNDPYTPDQEPICDDVSENWGWIVSNKDYKTGLTYGCQFNKNVMSKLHLDCNEKYGNFNLWNVIKVKYYEDGSVERFAENIYWKVMSNL